MEMVQKGGIRKAESITNKNHQDKIRHVVEVIELESSSKFSFWVNQIDKFHHNVGISYTGMQENDTEEVVRNHSQDQQHKPKDKLGEEQRACLYSNITPNSTHNNITNDASASHVHDDSIRKFVVLTSEQIEEDDVKNVGIQREKNPTHEAGYVGQI